MEKPLRHKRCEDLCREGADSSACKALHKPDPLDPSAVFDEMSSKHPRAPHPVNMANLGAPNGGLTPNNDAETTLKALKSFNKHSGAGPSGMRPFHLRQALAPAHADI